MKKCQKDAKEMPNLPYTLPTFYTFEHWSKDNNWVECKREYQELQNRKIAIILQQEAIKDELEFFRTNQEIRREGLGKAKEILSLPLSSKDSNVKTYSGYHFEKTMQGVKVASDENRLVSGNPTEVIHSMNSHDVKTDPVDTPESVLEKVEKLKKYISGINDVDTKSPDE